MKNEYGRKEKSEEFDLKIGSTCTGTGVGVAERILRKGNVLLARDIPKLKPFLTEVSSDIMSFHLQGKRIIVEGTQGFGLSLYHSPYYPYTSRDTTAAAFLSEIGISPKAVSDIFMVVRTFPIRVGGNSGPLPNEITWDTIRMESGYPYDIQEFTTVTKRLRRVARFDREIVEKAAIANMPTHIALMGIDYLGYKNRRAKCYSELTEIAKEFLSKLAFELKIPVSLIGNGPCDFDLIDRIGSVENEQEGSRERTLGKVALS